MKLSRNVLLALLCAVPVTVFAQGDYVMDLGGERFDPAIATPQPTQPWWQQSNQAGLRLVQFAGPIQPDWLSQLRDSGLTVLQYIHPYSYVVYGDAAALGRAVSAPQIRWSGLMLPGYKVQASQRELDSTSRPTMMLVARQADRSALASTLSEVGAVVQLQTPLDSNFDIVQLDVAGSAYLQLAQDPGIYAVQAITQDAGPRGESSNQAIVGGYGPPPTNTIVPGYVAWLLDAGYNGSGVTVAIVDGGIRTTHLDLASRMVPCLTAGGTPTSCTTANDSHGTHVAGAVAGTGASGTLLNGFLRGQGVAPGANLVQQRYPSFVSGAGPGGMIANGMLSIFKETALSGAQVANNSWGPSGTPQGYNIPTQQVDMIVRDANPDAAGAQPVLPVWSIMNGNGDRNTGICAPSSLGSPDEGKNLLAVGSTKLLSGGTQLSAIFDVSSNSAHGNACDGRRVPHIVAPGCNTDSTSNGSDSAFAFNCGTSMASPVVSGAVALFIDRYRSLYANSTPSPALIKAAFTVAAMDLDGFRNANNAVMGHRPDRFQGYGRIDLNAVMKPTTAVQYIDQDLVFDASGQRWEARFVADDGNQPMRIMLAWTDAKGHGLGGTTPAWVNDLDLQVVANATTYAGNAVGSDGWSAPNGSADNKNNLEGIFLRADQHAGAVSVTVNASNIAADALNPFVPGNPAQDFALVCTNCLPAPSGVADLRLTLSAGAAPVSFGNTALLTATIGNLGPDAAGNLSMVLNLPEALSLQNWRLASGAGNWTCSGQRVVTCTMPAGVLPVAANAATLEFDLLVSGAATTGVVSISGSVSATGYTDPVGANNAQTASANVIGDRLFANGFGN